MSGSVTATGNGRMKVSAEGTDIWSTADGFYFVYQALPANGEIRVRISSLQNTDPWAKAGLMVRQSLDAGAVNAALVVTPSNGIAFQQRPVAGGATVSQAAAGKAPVWMRLMRAEGAVTAFTSADGVTWTTVGTRTVPLQGSVLIGLATTSRRASKVTTAWFESISVDHAPAATLPSGPVAAYAFDEGMGSTARDAAGAHHGTVSGAAWTKSGRHGGALSFNGLDSIVTVKDAAGLRLSSAMTISAWVNPVTLSGWRAVAGKEATSALAYGLYANSDVLRPTGVVNLGTSDAQVSCMKQLTVGAWTHIAVTFDGQTARFFVNGSEAGSRSASGTLMQTSGPLRIGGNTVWGEWFHGAIDDLRIYGRAQTSAEIQADMTTPVPSTPLVDTTPPTVAIVSPANGATVAGAVAVTANAGDDIELASVKLLVNGNALGPVMTSGPFSATWDTKSFANGSYTLTAVASDAAGNQATSAPVTVNVSNADTTPPTVAVTSPSNGATVSGTISISAQAADDVSLKGVQFKLNASNLGGFLTAAPFALTFDTTAVANATYTLTAVAIDAAGNQATSAPVTLTVSNAVVVNVKTVEFTSADHNAVLADGRPVVSGYTLEVWTAGSNTSSGTPYKTSSLGKPLSQTTTIAVNQETFLASLPKGQKFIATITASGPGGNSRSTASSEFSLQ